MKTRLLGEQAFGETFSSPMRNVTSIAKPVIDIWPYVEAIPIADHAGLTLNDVEYVYEDGRSDFHHILIGTDQANIFVAIVISLGSRLIAGHHLLNLNEKYRMETP